MLRKRIIFTLIYNQGFFNQSRNFRLQKVGDIDWLERNYKFQDIAFSLDELIVLNASRDEKGMSKFARTLSKLVDNVFIPIAAGGGIRSLEDAELLFTHGADKIVLNYCLYQDSDLVKKLVSKYGSQSIVASVDHIDQEVFLNSGVDKLEMGLKDYLDYIIDELNVGEVYLNSIEQDGTGFGYDLSTIKKMLYSVSVPLIIAGGAGNEKHFMEGLELEGVSAVATANLFNFIGDGLPKARNKLIQSGSNITDWKVKSIVLKESV